MVPDLISKRTDSSIVIGFDIKSEYDVNGEDYRAKVFRNWETQQWNYQLLDSFHDNNDKLFESKDFDTLDSNDNLTKYFNQEKLYQITY